MSKPEALLLFGDSLSDSGNAYDLSGRVLKQAIPPDSAGYNGWFSNGLIQSEVTAGLIGVPLDNYAVGGARAIGSRTVEQYLEENSYDTPEIMLPDPDRAALDTDTYLGGQVTRYLRQAPANPPVEGTAAAIWIGSNDYNAVLENPTPENVAATIIAVVGATVQAAGAIALTGVDKIFLYNLPPPGFLPASLPPEAALLVDGHNGALARGAAFLQSQDVDAVIVDMHRMGEEIVADPRTFGLNPAHVDQPLLFGIGSRPTWVEATQDWFIPENPLVAGVDPDTVMFTDFLHPSSATHGVLGSFAAASMSDNLVFLGPEDNVRRTGPLDDLVLAGAGNDRVFSDGGADTVLAGLGDDFVLAGAGRDIVAGGAGSDRVHGGLGNDVVAGSDGDDRQTGGAGRDLMVDGLGFDRILAGDGNDAILYSEAAFLGGSNAEDGGRFDGGRGIDTLYLRLDAETRAAVEAELCRGASSQRLESIDVTTRSIERYVFIDPDEPVAGQIASGARVAEADLWGIV